MVIDASALVAMLLKEPEAESFVAAIAAAASRLLAAPTAFEASMILLSRLGEPGLADLDALLSGMGIETVPMSAEHVALALDAFRRFGKGRHRAGLNFGDCMSYALARATGEPLLFKGDDFGHTDIRSALAP